MLLDFKPVIIFVGNYGSGKTEVSVSVARTLRAGGERVCVADLDLVNPYFRSREMREVLEAEGIEVVIPEDRLLNADLPVLVPRIQGMIRRPDGFAVLDVGGDDVGARVLGSLNDALTVSPHDVVQVVNARRPFTDTVSGCLAITREIEQSARIRVNAVAGNTHLMEDTDLKSIYDGHDFARSVAAELGVPLKFVTCPVALLDDLDRDRITCPVLPFTRQLLPPWSRREKLGSRVFRLS